MQLSAATYFLLMRQLQAIISTRSQVVLEWFDKLDRCKTTYFCNNGCTTRHVALREVNQSKSKLHLYGSEGQGVAWCDGGEGRAGSIDIDAQKFPQTSEEMVAYLKRPVPDEQ